MLDFFKIKLRFLLRKYKPFIFMIHFIKLLKSDYRHENAIQICKLDELTKKVGGLLKKPIGDKSKGLALFFGWSQFEIILTESLLRKGMELYGLEIAVLSQQTPFTVNAYRKMGVKDLVSFYSYCPSPNMSFANSLLKNISSFQDFINIEYKGVGVGKFASSTLMRKIRKGCIDLNDETEKRMAVICLSESISAVEGASKFLNTRKPSIFVVVDRGYTPYGEMFDACVNRKIPVITWNVAHRDNTIMLKRYNLANRYSHPASLSKDSWETMQKLNWSHEKRNKLYLELSSSYENGEWYGEVGTQFGKKGFEKSEIINRYDLDQSKKTAVIFSHVFWDATFFWGDDLFRDYEDWFVQTVKEACKNKNINWLIKIHPANTIKDNRDGVISDPSEVIALREKIGVLPDHVRVINADTQISTWSLFQAMDYCLTVRGTVGIEAAMLGKVVLTAGTGRYDRHGFTHDFCSSKEYLQCIRHIEDIPKLSKKMKELAERYAYGLFICRPLKLKTLSLGFKRDSKASMLVKYNSLIMDNLQEAEDLKGISKWIDSKKDDYLN